jgi:hypothetical protein
MNESRRQEIRQGLGKAAPEEIAGQPMSEPRVVQVGCERLVDRFSDTCYGVGFEHGRGKLNAPVEEREREEAERALWSAISSILSENAALISEVRRLRKDSQRLDWLEEAFRTADLQFHLYGEKPYPFSLRAAADSSMDGETRDTQTKQDKPNA